MTQRLGSGVKSTIARADQEELNRIKAQAAAEKARLDERIRKAREEGKNVSKVREGSNTITSLRTRQDLILRAAGARQRVLSRARAQNISVAESERITSRAQQQVVKEYGTPAAQFQRRLAEAKRRPRPRNIADETAVYETRAFVGAPTQQAPPRRELPVDTPRVFREDSGAEVLPGDPDFPFQAPGKLIVGDGARVTRLETRSTGFAPTVTKDTSQVTRSQIRTYGPVESFSDNPLIPNFIEPQLEQFADAFINPSTQAFEDVRNPEIGTTAQALGLTAGSVARVVLSSANPVSGSLRVLAPARAVGSVFSNPVAAAVPVAVAQGTVNRFLVQAPVTMASSDERVGEVAGTGAEIIGYGVAGEGFARSSAKYFGSLPGVGATLTTKSAQATLALTAGGAGGLVEGTLIEGVRQVRARDFDASELGRQAIGGFSSSVLLGGLYRLGRGGKLAAFAADPLEPIQDVTTTGIGTFGDETITVRSPASVSSFAFAGGSLVGVGPSSVTVRRPEPSTPFGQGMITVSDSAPGANIATQSPASIGVTSPVTSPVSVTSPASVRSPIGVRPRSRAASQVFATTPIKSAPIAARAQSPVFVQTPTAATVTTPSMARVLAPTRPTSRSSVRTTTRANVPVITSQFRLPPFFFPGAGRRSSSSGTFSRLAAPRAFRYAPGLASISLGIFGRPSKTSGFTGFEIRPIPLSTTGKKRAKSKKRKKSKRRKK